MIELIQNKKAQLDPVTGLIFIFSNPIVLLGLAIFLIILIIMGYFMLGKLIAAVFVIFGAVSLFTGRMHWTIGLLLVGIGILMFWNPNELLNLSALQLN